MGKLEEYRLDIEKGNFEKVLFSKNVQTFMGSESEMFVDCDNTEFFSFIKLLESLDKKSNIKKVHLFVDRKSNYLWKMFKELYVGSLDINIQKVSRIKENKSVVDVVMTKHICEAHYIRGLNKIILVSSDSDFFGLLDNIKDVDFMVFYRGNRINEMYLSYLKYMDIPYTDLKNIEITDILDVYKDRAIRYLLAYTMLLTPMLRWEDTEFTEYVFYLINLDSEEGCILLSKEYIKNKIRNYILETKSSLEGNVFTVTIGDLTVKNTDLGLGDRDEFSM